MGNWLYTTTILMGVGLCSSFNTIQASAAEILHPKGVVELFTSQGCSSCPAADKIFGELAQDKDVLALSFHVDYWDYLGWKDTLGSSAHTQRQYSYARSLKERQVYTPQAIVNGRAHVVGSKRSKLEALIDKIKNSDGNLSVPIKANVSQDILRVAVDENALQQEATLYMVYFNKEELVKITRGENTGKTIHYHNVVHDVQALSMIKPDGMQMEYPVAEIKQSGFDACALILQLNDAAGNKSAIVGATVIADL